MSGKASVSGSKRKRDLVAMTKEPSEPLIVAQFIPKKITYSAAEIRPGPDIPKKQVMGGRLKEHTLLRFEKGTKIYKECAKLVDTYLLVHRVIDWDMVNSLGQGDRIKKLLGPRWIKAMDCRRPQYEELTIEFHSTFKYQSKYFDDPRAVYFSLGRKVYALSVPEFAVATGFYTKDEVKDPKFAKLLRGMSIKQKRPAHYVIEKDLREFWRTIGSVAYVASVSDSGIRDPVYRYIHRILASTIIGRKSGPEKCNRYDLFCLYSLITGKEANLATILLESLSRSCRGGPDARLGLGPYISQIAENLDVFVRYPIEYLREGPSTTVFGLGDLQKAGIVAKTLPPTWEKVEEGPQLMPPEGTIASEVMQMGYPTVRQRLHEDEIEKLQQYQRRQGRTRSAPTTLESIRDMISARFDRQDAAIRLLFTHHGVEIPSWFTAQDSSQQGQSTQRVEVRASQSSQAGGDDDVEDDSEEESEQDSEEEQE